MLQIKLLLLPSLFQRFNFTFPLRLPRPQVRAALILIQTLVKLRPRPFQDLTPFVHIRRQRESRCISRHLQILLQYPRQIRIPLPDPQTLSWLTRPTDLDPPPLAQRQFQLFPTLKILNSTVLTLPHPRHEPMPRLTVKPFRS
jgi:hypothetical protein